MRDLTTAEMARVNGGSKCGWLGALTTVSCVTGMLYACALGASGFFTLCVE